MVDLRKVNRGLGADSRGQMVRVRFQKPVPCDQVGLFYSIHLRREQLLQGCEEDFFRAEVFQPTMAKLGECPMCKQPYSRVGEWLKSCDNPACKNKGKLDSTKPKRGVIKVLIEERCAQLVDGIRCCDSVVLVLDRRYPEQTLRSVYRTAGGLADIHQWKIK